MKSHSVWWKTKWQGIGGVWIEVVHIGWCLLSNEEEREEHSREEAHCGVHAGSGILVERLIVAQIRFTAHPLQIKFQKWRFWKRFFPRLWIWGQKLSPKKTTISQKEIGCKKHKGEITSFCSQVWHNILKFFSSRKHPAAVQTILSHCMLFPVLTVSSRLSATQDGFCSAMLSILTSTLKFGASRWRSSIQDNKGTFSSRVPFLQASSSSLMQYRPTHSHLPSRVSNCQNRQMCLCMHVQRTKWFESVKTPQTQFKQNNTNFEKPRN